MRKKPAPRSHLVGVWAVGPTILVLLVVAMVMAARAASRPGTAYTPAPLNLTIAKPTTASPTPAAKGPAPRPALVPASPIDADLPSRATTTDVAVPSTVAKVTGTDAPSGSTITITGCLDRNDTTFRLTDTDGTDVPKARSWKSGFLVRRPASLRLVDPNRSRLVTNIGRRVRVTGTLTDRAMHVRSLQRVSGSCS
jgi:hypothetical protein